MLANMSIRWKLTVGFGCILVLTCFLAITSWVMQERLVHTSEKVSSIEGVERNMLKARVQVLYYLLNRKQQHVDDFGNEMGTMKNSIQMIQSQADNPAALSVYSRLLSLNDKYLETFGVYAGEESVKGTALKAVVDAAVKLDAAVSELQTTLTSVKMSEDKRLAFTRDSGNILRSFLLSRIEVLYYLWRGDVKRVENAKKYLMEIVTRGKDMAASLKPYNLDSIAMTISDSAALYHERLDVYMGSQEKQAGEIKKMAAVGSDVAQATGEAAQLMRLAMSNQVKTSNYALVGAACFAVIIGLIFAILLTRIIQKGVRTATNVAESISMGDIDLDIDVSSKDEIGQLLASMKHLVETERKIVEAAAQLSDGDMRVRLTARSEKDELIRSLSLMIEQISGVVAEVQSGAENVAAGSEQLSSSAEALSQGASEQASSIEEVSASMEQMGASVSQNADNARQTEQIANQAAKDANESGEAVAQTVAVMKEIAGKISIIGEIARQTDLLALNAAVEAARAGEHGKGFAVVAAEVRKLAERSQSAAAEINQLSSSSTEVAERAGELLGKLVPDIRRTADLVQEISASSAEQNEGVAQVNQALSQLESVVQHNSSSSEELASTSEELSGQAMSLQQAVAFFTLDATPKAVRPVRQVGAANPAKAAPQLPQDDSGQKGAGSGSGKLVLDMGMDDDDDKGFERF